jgi:two-component sensor histidine kinase
VFLGRFSALVEAQDLAFSEQDRGSLEALLERIFEPYSRDPEVLTVGPVAAVELSPRALMSLGLILHELATNAAKHGALSQPGGRVQVSWQVEDENSKLRLKWTETGGPQVTPPTATGYGTLLINHTTTYSLHGELEQDYAAAGLQVEIVIPVGTAAPAS